MASLLFVLSLAAVNPDLHHAIHGDTHGAPLNDAGCVIGLLKDGKVDFSPDLDLAIDRVDGVEFLEVNLAVDAPFYARPRLLPWASGPPLIG